MRGQCPDARATLEQHAGDIAAGVARAPVTTSSSRLDMRTNRARLAARRLLRRYDHRDRASGPAQNLVHPAAEVKPLFGRTEQHAHHQQIERALLERAQDDALGAGAGYDPCCELEFELFGEFADFADCVLALAGRRRSAAKRT